MLGLIQSSSPARPRRIFSCYGDGAKAIPRDPELLSVSAVGSVRAVGLEVQCPRRGVLAHLCYGRPAVSMCTGIGADACDPPAAPARWASPAGCDDRPALRAAALRAASTVQRFAGVMAAWHLEDDRAIVEIWHTRGGHGEIEIREFEGYLVVMVGLTSQLPRVLWDAALRQIDAAAKEYGLRAA